MPGLSTYAADLTTTWPLQLKATSPQHDRRNSPLRPSVATFSVEKEKEKQ